MDHSESSPSLTPIVVVSLALHALLAWGMEGGAHAAAPVRHEPVRITVREAPKPAPMQEPEVGAKEAPAAKPEPVAQQRAPRARDKRVAQQPTPVAKPSAEPPPALDFTGVTLTNPNGGFAAIAGNGEHMDGPVGPAHSGSQRGKGTGPGGNGKAASWF